MAKGINKVIILGNLGQDPEYKVGSSGAPVCVLSVATAETWKDAQGVKQERTEWHRVIAFKQLADICQKYLAKGDQIYCEGQLRTRKWQDQQGQDRYTTEIVMAELLKTTRSAEGAAPAPYAPPAYQPPAAAPSPYQQVPHATASRPHTPPPVNPIDSFDDDIPF